MKSNSQSTKTTYVLALSEMATESIIKENAMFEIHMTTIEPMLNIIEKFNNGIDIEDELNLLLDHEDYKIEIERYNSHPANIGFTKKEYIDYFLNIRNIDIDKVTSKALKYRVDDLLYIMNNVSHFRELLANIKCINYDRAFDKTMYGLPDEAKLGNIIIIFSVGLGVSGGWAYENYTHYDLRVIVDQKSDQGLLNVIAHECHHIGHSKFKTNEKIIPEAKLIYLLSTEGTAVKFCNNFEGLLTDKLYPNEEMSMATISYNYYKEKFTCIYVQFQKDIKALKNKERNAHDLYIENYSYRDVFVNGELIENYLSQPIKYHLGADIWGIVYDVFGRTVTFNCLENPNLFIDYYNKALEQKGLSSYKI